MCCLLPECFIQRCRPKVDRLSGATDVQTEAVAAGTTDHRRRTCAASAAGGNRAVRQVRQLDCLAGADMEQRKRSVAQSPHHGLYRIADPQ